MSRLLAALLAFALCIPAAAQERETADPLLERKAEAGDPDAQFELGSRYQVVGRFREAAYLYRRAVQSGHPAAANSLGFLYETGRGVEADVPRALELYTQAADAGWAGAMWNIANLHGSGLVGQADYVAACAWAVRARRFADPKDEKLIALLERVTPRLRATLSADEAASCSYQGESWTPPNRR